MAGRRLHAPLTCELPGKEPSGTGREMADGSPQVRGATGAVRR
jgi:hypothetical protein